VGPAVGDRGGQSVAHDAKECGNAHRHYSGINVLILWVIERRFSTQNWLTFRQALGLGGNVRKGEHGTTVVYADHFVPDEERKRAERDGDEPSGIRFLNDLRCSTPINAKTYLRRW